MRKHLWFRLCCTILLLGVAIFNAPTAVHASSLIVNTLNDDPLDGSCTDGTCTLREAIELASDNDIITFSVTGTIVLDSFMGELLIQNKSIEIVGADPSQLTVDGGGNSRVFSVSGPAKSVRIAGLTITGGKVTDDWGAGVGAFNAGTLTLDHVTITGNAAITNAGYPRGGGVGIGGGSLVITDSTIENNTAGYAGGGVAIANDSSAMISYTSIMNNQVTGGATGFSGGGGVSLQSNPGFSSTLTNVLFTGNTSAGNGGGIMIDNHTTTINGGTFYQNSATETNNAVGGALYALTSDLTINGVSFILNTSAGDGGALFLENSNTNILLSTFTLNSATGTGNSDGGAIYNVGSADHITLNVTNSTFTANTANNGYGGAIKNQAAGGSPIDPAEPAYSAIVTIKNSTIVGNSAFTGGGIFASTAQAVEQSEYHLFNSIIYGNNIDPLNYGENCAQANDSLFVTGHNNLFEDQLNDCPASATDLVSQGAVNTIVNSILYNGGTANTMSLPANSPAIDAGDDATCSASPVDNTSENGVSRLSGIHCDIGAFETKETATFKSTGANDGWILESTEVSGAGGSMNASATTFILGDEVGNKQYRAILHFDTSALPDNAVITNATLRIKKQGTVGSDPFTVLGTLRLDMRKPSFGLPVLEIPDFKSAAAKKNMGSFNPIPVGTWYGANIKGAGRNYINRIGTTQFRLSFSLDDNNDNGADYMKFFSGNAPAGSRPQLYLEYYTP